MPHHSNITESEGRQSVVQSYEICPYCFGPIVSIPLSYCRAKFLSDSEKLLPMVQRSVTCQTTADHLRLSFSPDASSPTGPSLNLIFHPIFRTIRQWDAHLTSFKG